MCQSSSQGKPCGKLLLYLPLQAKQERETLEKEREKVSKQENEKKGMHGTKNCFLFSNCLILCRNENLHILEACCFNIILQTPTPHTHTLIHTLACRHSKRKKNWGNPAVYWVIVDSSVDEICFNWRIAGGTVNRKPLSETKRGAKDGEAEGRERERRRRRWKQKREI